MKKHTLLLAALACGLLTLSGCAWGAGGQGGYKGLIPEKDARMRGVDLTLTTPWGSQRAHFDEIDTRMNPVGTNPLPSIPDPTTDVTVKIPVTPPTGTISFP